MEIAKLQASQCFQKSAFIHVESLRTYGCQVDKASADISILYKWDTLFRGSHLFISGNPVQYVRLNIGVQHFKPCSCIQMKHGPLLHTCHDIDTGPAVSILVSSNICDDTSSYRCIKHSTSYHTFRISYRPLPRPNPGLGWARSMKPGAYFEI